MRDSASLPLNRQPRNEECAVGEMQSLLRALRSSRHTPSEPIVQIRITIINGLLNNQLSN